MTAIYPRDLFRTTRSSVVRASCFVLMPFEASFDPVYNEVRNTLQSPELNLVCRRADDFRRPHILETILTNIFHSEYILADLSDLNPNVFYELGVAHCVKDADKVMLLAQSIEAVPFDLRHLCCVVYDPKPSGLRVLHDELLETFRDSARDSFCFCVWEGKRFRFGRKLVGCNRNLFELEVEYAHIGHGAVKLLIHFTERSVDATEGPVESQFLFLSEDQPEVPVENIPWSLHLGECSNQNALLVLERR